LAAPVMRLMVIEGLLSRSFGLEVEQTSVEPATNVRFQGPKRTFLL
jgi:hypothetical protein